MFDTVLQILGLAIGLVYLFYEYRADAKVWIASIVMPAISLFVYYRKGLYADFGMNVYYFMMAIYGYIAWTRGFNRKEKKVLPITRMRVRHYLPVLLVLGVLWVGIAVLLIEATDSTVPWADAFTTALSIVGTWMLSRKYVEQWLAWLVVDAVCVCLYIYKGIYPYALLYAVYTAVAVFGYRKWLRMMAAQQ